MNISLFTGNAHPSLAQKTAEHLGLSLGNCEVGRYPDGELRVEVMDTVRGQDVYLLQPTSPPAEEHLLVLLLLADACRRAGADRLTAVIPYFGYARQDRRTHGRTPVAARLVADLLSSSGFDRVVTIDLHGRALEGCFSIPVEHLSARSRLIEVIQEKLPENAIIVASDLGAMKLAESWSRALNLPTAIIHKHRESGEKVSVRDITGDVRGRTPILVDDMITTGGTMCAAIETLLAAGAAPSIHIAATHGLFVGQAVPRLSAFPISRIVVADTVAERDYGSLPIEVASVAPLLANAIHHLHKGHSLGELLSWE